MIRALSRRQRAPKRGQIGVHNGIFAKHLFQTLGASGGVAGAQGGIDFVQRAQGIIVHPGEGILTAQQNSERLGLSGGVSNPTAPVQRDGSFTPNPSGASPMNIVVQIGSETIARSMVEIDRSGGAAISNQLTRKKTRARVGFKRAK